MTNVFPRCKNDFRQDFVTSEGYVMPCCWIADAGQVSAYFELYKDCLTEMSVKKRTMTEILNDPRFKWIEESWKTDQPFRPCTVFCSAPLEMAPEEMRGTDKTVDVFRDP